ncbi:hypothetical protein PtA15_15A216 [Puccinia triticina]|uniref:Uncharacterized protein n=1 Tax=Puccinia triticina TaxID=208348 RepID=A0ABY7D4U5_9BASI|nr:uncharacterized protein PtA15_15A216 [Puccinia triticina]WAQ91824.1 hypothetical protein PtA15_15A216 [Puccinia triticina]
MSSPAPWRIILVDWPSQPDKSNEHAQQDHPMARVLLSGVRNLRFLQVRGFGLDCSCLFLFCETIQ